ncbi:MAG TPA: MarR family transcriptional regulator [Gemmatimonadales bacterium]|nr:MarR family transcriptional regulator [Gemmatimonadales bacterium]
MPTWIPRWPPYKRRRPPTPTEQAAYAIHSAAIHLLRSLRRQDVRSGVGPAGLSVLSVLVFGGPKTMAELADIEQVKKPTMTRIIKSLEYWGLVERKSGTDRRKLEVHVTPHGERILIRARSNRMVVLEERMERLSASEIATLVRAAQLLERISKGETLS